MHGVPGCSPIQLQTEATTVQLQLRNNFLLFILSECDISRGVPPCVSVVHPMCHVQLLPDPGARARLQLVQPHHRVWAASTGHRHLIHTHTVGNDQENQRE